MKIRLEHKGSVLEYERQPMRSSRFRAICGVFLSALYAGMVIGVASLCGVLGVLGVVIPSAIVGLVVISAVK